MTRAETGDIMTDGNNWQELLNQLRPFLASYDAYLVGGAVRDRLLGLPVHDLDFALPEATMEAARKTADRLGGAFFVLDMERGAARVILEDDNGGRRSLDFTTFQGPDLEADLRARDFTITAMAVPVSQPDRLIDPLGGAADLQQGLIRSCSPRSMVDDPLRVLRAVRMAAAYRFKISPATQQEIRQAAVGLDQVSPERVRDEYYQILLCPQPAAGVRILNALGITRVLFPEERVFPALRIKVLDNLNTFWQLLAGEHQPEEAASWANGLLVYRLGRFREQLQVHLEEQLVPERPCRGIIHFAALIPENAADRKATMQRTAKSFRFSRQEIERLHGMLKAAVDLKSRAASGADPQPLEIYRYFRQYARAGVDGIYLNLARFLANKGRTRITTAWPVQLDFSRAFLQAWWENRQQVIAPPVLLDGHQLMDALDLKPGPRVGLILEKIREAQVIGEVANRKQAFALAEQLLAGERDR